MSKNNNIIELGDNKYNATALRSVTEQAAVLALRHKCDPNQIRNAWKQANGLSVRNYSEKAEKPQPKRTRKPNSKAKNK